MKIDGDHAVVRADIEATAPGSERLILVKEGGRWKVDLDASQEVDTCERERRPLTTAAEA